MVSVSLSSNVNYVNFKSLNYIVKIIAAHRGASSLCSAFRLLISTFSSVRHCLTTSTILIHVFGAFGKNSLHARAHVHAPPPQNKKYEYERASL